MSIPNNLISHTSADLSLKLHAINLETRLYSCNYKDWFRLSFSFNQSQILNTQYKYTLCTLCKLHCTSTKYKPMKYKTQISYQGS